MSWRGRFAASLLIPALILVLLLRPAAAEPAGAAVLREALAAASAETVLAGLALEKARTEEVRLVAEEVARDRGQARDRLAALAAQRGLSDLSGPPTLDPALAQLSGDAFERRVMAELERQLARSQALETLAAQDGDDEALSRLAAGDLPALNRYLEMVRSILGPTRSNVG